MRIKKKFNIVQLTIMTQIRKRMFDVRRVRIGISMTMSSSLWMKNGQLEVPRSEVKCLSSLARISNTVFSIGAPEKREK